MQNRNTGRWTQQVDDDRGRGNVLTVEAVVVVDHSENHVVEELAVVLDPRTPSSTSHWFLYQPRRVVQGLPLAGLLFLRDGGPLVKKDESPV